MPDDPQLDADDQLMRELSGYFARTDPVPASVVQAAEAAIEFRDLDAQLAELLHDSALEDEQLAGVRGAGQRMLSFGAGERFVEVDVRTEGANRELAGYVVPAVPGTIRVEAPDRSIEAPVDDRGRFRLLRVPRGPVRLWVTAPGQRRTVTAWFAL